MKKIVSIALIVVLAVAMVACGSSSSASAAAGYTGTQEATAKGMSDGEVKVSVTFENGVATDVVIDASTQTAGIGDKAAETMQAAILEGNTPAVDAVSGATMTSNAVLKAAKACYDAAGIAY